MSTGPADFADDLKSAFHQKRCVGARLFGEYGVLHADQKKCLITRKPPEGGPCKRTRRGAGGHFAVSHNCTLLQYLLIEDHLFAASSCQKQVNRSANRPWLMRRFLRTHAALRTLSESCSSENGLRFIVLANTPSKFESRTLSSAVGSIIARL